MPIPFVKRQHWPLVGLLLVQLLMGIMLAPRSNFFGIYLNEVIAYPLAEVAQVLALGQIVNMLFSIVAGSLGDRWGHKWMLFLGMTALAASSLLYNVQSPWLVIVLWGVGSAGMAFTTVGGQGYLTMASGMGILGVASALYNWGYTAGGAVGTPLSTLVLGDDNYGVLGLVLAGFTLLPALVASLLPPLRPEAEVEAKTTAAVGYGVFLRRRILLLVLLRFLPTCYYGITSLFPLLIKQQSGDNATVAWFVTVSLVCASLAQLIAGRSADRYGVRVPTQMAFSTILVAIVGTILTVQSVWGLYIFGTLGISAAWALSTLLPGMVTTAAEPKIRGRVFGGLHMMWTIAMMIGTLLGGSLLEVDLRLPFVVVGPLIVLALALTVPFFRPPAPQPVAA
jgi:MFS family permease